MAAQFWQTNEHTSEHKEWRRTILTDEYTTEHKEWSRTILTDKRTNNHKEEGHTILADECTNKHKEWGRTIWTDKRTNEQRLGTVWPLLLLSLRNPQNQTEYNYEKLNLTIMVNTWWTIWLLWLLDWCWISPVSSPLFWRSWSCLLQYPSSSSSFPMTDPYTLRDVHKNIHRFG